MVSVRAFYYNYLRSNPASLYSLYSVKLLEQNENKQKEAGIGPFIKVGPELETYLVFGRDL